MPDQLPIHHGAVAYGWIAADAKLPPRNRHPVAQMPIASRAFFVGVRWSSRTEVLRELCFVSMRDTDCMTFDTRSLPR